MGERTWLLLDLLRPPGASRRGSRFRHVGKGAARHSVKDGVASSEMEFRILGPLEVTQDGVPLSPGGPKRRALLALLLLHANEPLTQPVLVDGLWGERPPETAAKALQVYVSQLRRVLGREVIRTLAGAYELAVEPDDLDVLRVERLIAEARVAAPAD